MIRYSIFVIMTSEYDTRMGMINVSRSISSTLKVTFFASVSQKITFIWTHELRSRKVMLITSVLKPN